MSREFAAHFPGDCAAGDRIQPGDTVKYNSDGELEHVACPDAVDDKPTRFTGTTLDEMGY